MKRTHLRSFRVTVRDALGVEKGFYVPHLTRKIWEDEVFYSASDPVTVEEVKRSLIDHDGYPSNITVREER